jgi:hypothetical protein
MNLEELFPDNRVSIDSELERGVLNNFNFRELELF